MLMEYSFFLRSVGNAGDMWPFGRAFPVGFGEGGSYGDCLI